MHSSATRIGRRWWTVLLLSAIGVGLGALAVTAVTPRYDATADVLVQRLGSEAATTTPGARAVASYAAVIESRGLAAQTAEDLDLDLNDDVRAVPRGESDVIRITVTQNDPQDAVAAADDLADRFVGWLEAEQPTEGSRVTATVVAAAHSSGDASSPDTTAWLLGGGVVGLIAGIALALVRSAGPRTVDSGGLAKQVTNAPLLASIGHDPDARSHPLIDQVEGQHPRHEAMRILRTNLQFLDINRPHRIVTVTSALPGEGKTTTTCNLGLAIAETGRSVVIVEGDLRQPRLADMFALERSVGLTTVLVGRVDVDAAVQPTRFGGLDVVTSGTLPPNPTEILQTEAMVTFLDDLARRYDVVLIDAPPVLPVADASLLAAMSDGALLLVRHGRTRVAELAEAATRLRDVGASVLGTVVTMSPRGDVSRYGYGSGYGPEHFARQSGRRAARR